MRFFISADETGNVKEVICSRGTDTSKKDGQQPELVQNILQTSELTTVKTRIVDMAIFQNKWLVTTRLGGYVTVYDMFNSSAIPEENYNLLHTYKLPVQAEDKPIALLTFESLGFIMVAFEASSTVYIIRLDEKFDVEPLAVSIPSRDETKPLLLTAFVANPYVQGVFACGGKDNDLQVLKMFGPKTSKIKKANFQDAKHWKPEVLFQAENVEPDHLGLDVPIWISKILFFKDAPKKGYKLVTATRHGHIRLYNTIEDTEPTHAYKVCDKAILTLSFATKEQDEILISDVHTFVARLSLIKVDAKAYRIVSASAGTFFKPSLKLLGKYSEGGNTGAIHGADVALSTGIAALGGLDRYLRVYNIATRLVVSKVYLGTQIHSIIIADAQDEGDDSKRSSDEVEEAEEFWNDLEEKKEPVPTIQKKKRRI